VYVEGEDGLWREKQQFPSSNSAANDNFGNAVAMSSTVGFVGAPGTDNTYAENGSVYQFSINNPETLLAGYIDEVSIHSSVLDATNIGALYDRAGYIDITSNSGLYTASASLEAFWRFSDSLADSANSNLLAHSRKEMFASPVPASAEYRFGKTQNTLHWVGSIGEITVKGSDNKVYDRWSFDTNLTSTGGKNITVSTGAAGLKRALY